MLPGGAFGLLRKRTCPTTAIDGGVVVVLCKVKKAKSSPEPAKAATSKAIETMERVLRCLAGCALKLAGAFVPGLGNETLPGPLPARAVASVCLSFADGVGAEGDEVIAVGEHWDDDGVKDAGVISCGREGCSEL